MRKVLIWAGFFVVLAYGVFQTFEGIAQGQVFKTVVSAAAVVGGIVALGATIVTTIRKKFSKKQQE